VVLEDVMPSNLRRAQDELESLSAGSVRFASTVEDAVRDADLAIDFVPDELESKLEIVSMVDRMAPPRTLLCVPTDALSTTDLASCTYRAELVVGLRGIGKGSAAEAVEIVRGRETGEIALGEVVEFVQRLGFAVTVAVDNNAPELTRNR
jgi:3-hydroxybutyryl-CoA dehydrogenase